MITFQRARSDEQREVRRKAILETAASMLAEMPVAAVSLNELSRRVGLAKSNVLRYFDSREGVLLDLLAKLAHDLLTQTGEKLPTAVAAGDPASIRVKGIAAALAAAFAAQPMLCELISAQASVLEHNVSAETAARYKRSGYESLAGFTAALQGVLPELGREDAAEAAKTIILLVGALWTHTNPPQSVQAVYTADPLLVFLPGGFAKSLERTIAIILTGLLADRER